MTNVEKSIIQTLAFFDVFSYPLTETEIWKWLYRPGRKVALSEIKEVLQNSEFLADKISEIEGFYTLRDRESTCYRRKQNNNIAERKFRRAITLAKFYRFIPFIRMMAVCNSLAISNAKEESDIDFFIITKKNRIWMARFFSVLFIKIFGLRPANGVNKDSFCLSFFIDETDLNIKKIMLHNHDLYSAYWVQQLVPIYNPDGLYEKFIEANQWYKEYLPNGYTNQFTKQVKQTNFSYVLGRIFQTVVSPPILSRWLTVGYRRFQTKIISRNLSSMVNVDTRVIINEKMLKFHQNDRRDLFYKKWREKLHSVLS